MVVENTVKLLGAACSANLQSGIQCEVCERLYHYSCGSVKTQAFERKNWNCEKFRLEKAGILKSNFKTRNDKLVN